MWSQKDNYSQFAIFVLGSGLASLANRFNCFLTGRFIQGIGVGGIFSLGMAMIGDFFPGERSMIARSIINSFMPVLGSLMPIVGKFINQRQFDIRAYTKNIAKADLL